VAAESFQFKNRSAGADVSSNKNREEQRPAREKAWKTEIWERFGTTI
jgi:hypothetical protein